MINSPNILESHKIFHVFEDVKKIQDYINICTFNDNNSLLTKLSMRYLGKKAYKSASLVYLLWNTPTCLSIEILRRL